MIYFNVTLEEKSRCEFLSGSKLVMVYLRKEDDFVFIFKNSLSACIQSRVRSPFELLDFLGTAEVVCKTATI